MRVEFALLIGPVFGVAILEMLSIALIIPFLEIMMQRQSQAEVDPSGPLALLFDIVDPQKDSLIYAGGLFFSVFVIKNVMILLLTYLIYWVTLRNLARFQTEVFATYLGVPMEVHLSRNSSTVIRDFVTSAGVAFEAIRVVLNTVMEGFVIAATIVLLVIMQPGAALSAGLVVSVAALLIYKALGPLIQEWGRRIWADEANMIQSVTESGDAIRETKIYGVREALTKEFSGLTRRLARARTHIGATGQIPRLVIEALIIGGFFLLAASFIENGKQPEDVISVLGLFGMAALRIMPSANRLIGNLYTIRRAVPFIPDLLKSRRAELEEEDGTGNKAVGSAPFTEKIELQDVFYQYPGSRAPALNGVNLEIERGAFVGLVGASGAGKSTLADVLMGLLAPSRGAFMVDGHILDPRRRSWRGNMAYVPQTLSFFGASVRRNIAFGLPEKQIDDSLVWEVLQSVGLREMVESWPDGLNTRLGEKGSAISGGQGQRIGIARALYRSPGVIVLDEPTSALDAMSESLITETLQSLAGDMTIIVIAHRLSTVRAADKLFMMEKGRIVAEGTFETLSSSSDRFRDMVRFGSLEACEGRYDAP